MAGTLPFTVFGENTYIYIYIITVNHFFLSSLDMCDSVIYKEDVLVQISIINLMSIISGILCKT